MDVPAVSTPRSKHIGQILELYMRGYSDQQIATSLDLPSKQKVVSSLDSFRKDYLSTLALRGLVPRYQHHRDILDDINKPFYELLTPPGEALGNHEMLYCAHYVATGNSLTSTELAGFTDDLTSVTKAIRDTNTLLRSEVLKRKKNIQEEIRRLQLERSDMIDATKDHILAMHLEYIDQLREDGDPKNKSLIVKLLDQVNKMQGNYTTIIRTEEITADDVLDGMKAIFDAEMPEELQ